MNNVFDVMPNFPDRESALLKRIEKTIKATADRNVFADGKEDTKAAEEEEEEDESKEKDKTDKDDDDDAVQDNQGSDVDDDETKQPRTPRTDNILDLNFGGATTVTAHDDDFPAIPPEHIPEVVSWPDQTAVALAAVLGKTSGVLYDSQRLQIGFKVMPATGATCKMVLYYGNRTDVSISALRAEIAPVEGLKVQMKPTEPLTVAAKQQVPHYLLWQCFRPFNDIPQMTLTFNFGGSDHTVHLKLPVLLTQFVSPVPKTAVEFNDSWNSLGNEIIKVLHLTAPPSSTAELQARVQDNLHFAKAQSEDSATAVCFSGLFETCSKSQSGAPVTIPLATKMAINKSNPQSLSVAVRSGHRAVTVALFHCVNALFVGDPLSL